MIVNTTRVCYIVIGGSRGKDLVMLFLARRLAHAYMEMKYYTSRVLKRVLFYLKLKL